MGSKADEQRLSLPILAVYGLFAHAEAQRDSFPGKAGLSGFADQGRFGSPNFLLQLSDCMQGFSGGVGLREIAQSAGVTAMMVNRYFGSKEQLFPEVVEVSFAPPTVVPNNPETLVRDVARRLIERTDPGSEHLDPFLLMLRSASNPTAAEIVRSSIVKHVGQHLSDLLEGPRQRSGRWLPFR